MHRTLIFFLVLIGFFTAVSTAPAQQIAAQQPPGLIFQKPTLDLGKRKKLVEFFYDRGIAGLNRDPAEALALFLEAERVGLESTPPLSEDDVVLSQIRYAQGYAGYKARNYATANRALLPLAQGVTPSTEVQYLIGLVQALSGEKELVSQGLSRLRELTQHLRPDIRKLGEQAEVQLTHNLAAIDIAAGKNELAKERLANLLSHYKIAPDRQRPESLSLHFALAVSHRNLGELEEALKGLRALYGEAPTYRLKNNLPLKEVLADVHYELAITQMQKGEDGAARALQTLAEMEELESPLRADAIHAKAFCFNLIGNRKARDAEMHNLLLADPTYYHRLTGK